ncbi:MAG: hypothetical protein WD894_22310 [Pirellulales bacterium]
MPPGTDGKAVSTAERTITLSPATAVSAASTVRNDLSVDLFFDGSDQDWRIHAVGHNLAADRQADEESSGRCIPNSEKQCIAAEGTQRARTPD